jgi:serine O-acetyltransferase
MTFIQLLSIILDDLKSHGGTNLVRCVQIYLFDNSFRLILNYRIGTYLSKHRNVLTNLIILSYKKKQILRRNCDISYSAKIGSRIRFPHPLGIVIGEGVTIEDGVGIWQQVTIGSHGKIGESQKYPVIKSNTLIYAGAKIIGGITINENAIVGSNAVVNKSVERGAIVVGIPAKQVNKSNEA